MHYITSALFAVVLLTGSLSFAGQPIFSEMPRWSDGWGVQAVQEYRHRLEALSDTETQTVESHILNIDGVYTWKRWIRVTAKLPLVLNASTEDGQDERGLGPFIVALPLKRYFNLSSRSGSWTFAPQLKAPSMVTSVSSNPWQHGWNFGYETETYRLLFGLSTTLWGNFQDQTFEHGTYTHLGFNLHGFGSSGHLKLNAGIVNRGKRKPTVYKFGPTLYWRITDLWHFQTEWHHHRSRHAAALEENRLRLGLAMVF